MSSRWLYINNKRSPIESVRSGYSTVFNDGQRFIIIVDHTEPIYSARSIPRISYLKRLVLFKYFIREINIC